MGKKKKNEKKVKGAEKTAMKTEKKQDKKLKKALQAQGEEDIESLIAEFQEKDRMMEKVIEEKVSPSLRSGMTVSVHPERDELIMFGGEYFNGKKTLMFNDLFMYNIKKIDWLKVTAPNPPPPRSSHQAVMSKQGGGVLWIFGGEFASPTQSQFYHYKDLWTYSLVSRKWEKISSPGGPSARSGHRMVSFRKLLVIFGGFHDNTREYKYYNDVHTFNIETRIWQKIDLSGIAPSPRSGCQLAVSQEQSRILVYGGYSKISVKKEVDKGTVHSDMFALCPDGEKRKEDMTPVKWKWMPVRHSGEKPPPRCGFSMTFTNNRAYMFGGVFDEEDTEEDLQGKFYNDLHTLDIDKAKWHEVILRGKLDLEVKKRRRKEKKGESIEDDTEDNTDENMDINSTSDTDTPSQDDVIVHDDGIFTVTMATASASLESTDVKSMETNAVKDIFIPRPRMNAAMVMKGNILYMYGGMYEEDEKEITLDDFYCLDLSKMDTWSILSAGTAQQEWEEESDTSEDDEEDEEMDVDIPDILPDETVSDYFDRTKDIWYEVSEESLKEDDIVNPTTKQIRKHASELCEAHFSNVKK